MLSASYCYQKRGSQSDHNKRLPLYMENEFLGLFFYVLLHMQTQV